MSCDVTGTTFASCEAQQTMFVHGTLKSKDPNWMNISVIPAEPKSTYRTDFPTKSVDRETFTSPTMTSHMTGIAEVSMTRSMGTVFSGISWPFWSITFSILMIGLGFTLLLA